jgi:hypothetical protein
MFTSLLGIFLRLLCYSRRPRQQRRGCPSAVPRRMEWICTDNIELGRAMKNLYSLDGFRVVSR